MSRPYQMLAYIHEGPQALQRTLTAAEPAVAALAARAHAASIRRVILTGIGSSYTAALMALPLFRYHCPVPADVLPGGELAYYASRWVDDRTLVIAVSRSGERGLVVNTLADVVRRGALGVAVTAVADSLMAQRAQVTLATAEGPEKAWPKTKSVLAATGLLMRLALALAGPDDEEAAARLALLRAMPQTLQQTLATAEPFVQALFPALERREIVAVAGTGGNYGAAIEGAMKIMEAAAVSTRYDATEELLCGPLGGMDARWLVLLLVTTIDLHDSREALRVARELGVPTLAIAAPGLDLAGLAQDVFTLPVAPDPLLAPLLYLTPLQLLAYYWTVARGLNPDSPSAVPAVLDALLPPGRQEPA